MQIEPGRTYNFIVDRETEISYILKYKDEELFCIKKKLDFGDEGEALVCGDNFFLSFNP